MAVATFVVVMTATLDQHRSFFRPKGTVLDLQAEQDLQRAQWLASQDHASTVYLRREVVLSALPRKAWIRVAALDKYELFINGQRVGTEEFLGTRPTGLYDVSRSLRLGPNLVAIVARSSTLGEPGQAAAAVSWDVGGRSESLLTDELWRAETRELHQARGTLSWNELDYSGEDWPSAKAIEAGPEPLVTVGGVPSSAVEGEYWGSWMWHPNRHVGSASFTRLLQLDDDYITEAWLGVSANGLVFTAVNGIIIGPDAGAEGRASLIDIAPYLRRGNNELAVQVTGTSDLMRVSIAGWVHTATKEIRISSDEAWFAGPDQVQPTMLGPVGRRPPAMMSARELPVRGAAAAQVARLGRQASVVTSLVLALGLMFVPLSRLRRKRAWGDILLLYAQPFAVATLFLVVGQLAEWDPRCFFRAEYSRWVPEFTGLFVIAWLIVGLAMTRVAAPAGANDPTDPIAPEALSRGV